MTNGEQTEECNGDTDSHDIAESPSRSFSNHSVVYSSTHNNNLNTSIVNKEDVIQKRYYS